MSYEQVLPGIPVKSKEPSNSISQGPCAILYPDVHASDRLGQVVEQRRANDHNETCPAKQMTSDILQYAQARTVHRYHTRLPFPHKSNQALLWFRMPASPTTSAGLHNQDLTIISLQPQAVGSAAVNLQSAISAVAARRCERQPGRQASLGWYAQAPPREYDDARFRS